MATSVTLCNRLNRKATRIQVGDANLKGKVSEFKCKVAHLVDIPVHEIELIYCGQSLKDDCKLEDYGVRTSSTIHLLKNKLADMEEVLPEPMDVAAAQQVVAALQAAITNPAHRHTVEVMMSRPETLENLIATTPGLDKDPVAMAMLQDAELLAILADPDLIHKVIEAHPCLGQAATMIAAAINEETAKSGNRSTGGQSRVAYSLDRMSDDEDMDIASGSSGSSQPITASQLAAALAAAGGGGPPIVPGSQQPTSAESGSSSSAPPDSFITSDFFQQAMMQASGGNSGSNQTAVTSAALQQLRDMGISDESRARRALEITGGNIQAALELLFGDNDL